MACTIRFAAEADLPALIPLFSAYLNALEEMGLQYTPRYEAVGELLESRVKSRRTCWRWQRRRAFFWALSAPAPDG